MERKPFLEEDMRRTIIEFNRDAIRRNSPGADSIERIRQMTLLERISFGIWYDTESLEEDSQSIVNIYNRSDPETKQVMDRVILLISGFYLESLLDDELMASYYEQACNASRDE